MGADYCGHLERKGKEAVTKDRIWLISAIVCFLAAVISLAGSAVGMSDTLLRVFGAVNIISLVIVVYRTVRNKR